MKKHTTNLLALSLSLPLMAISTISIAVDATFSAPPVEKKNNLQNKKLLMPFQQVGIIRDLDIAGGNMIVSGIRYYYDQNTMFESSQSKFLSIQSFNKGDRIGISYTSKDKTQRLLTSVLKLPKSLVMPVPTDH